MGRRLQVTEQAGPVGRRALGDVAQGGRMGGGEDRPPGLGQVASRSRRMNRVNDGIGLLMNSIRILRGAGHPAVIPSVSAAVAAT